MRKHREQIQAARSQLSLIISMIQMTEEQSRAILETRGDQRELEKHHIDGAGDCLEMDILMQKCNPRRHPDHWEDRPTGDFKALQPLGRLVEHLQVLDTLLASGLEQLDI